MKTKFYLQVSIGFWIIAFILIKNIAFGQSLEIVNFNVDGNGEITAGHNCSPPPQNCEDKSHTSIPWVQNGTLWGVTYDYLAGRSYSIRCVSDCGSTRANNSSHLHILGDLSSYMQIDWKNWSRVYTLVETDLYQATAVSSFTYDFGVRILPGGGYNLGDPVILYYQYEILGSGWTDHEAMDEDIMFTNNEFIFNTEEILQNKFNFACPGQVGRGGKQLIKMGSMFVNVGDTLDLDFVSTNSVRIEMPGFSYMWKMKDHATAFISGFLELGFDPMPEIVQYVERIEFSVDIGSDAELSDPNQNGNEVFDPGDAYVMKGPQLASATNGVRNDADFFGYDPYPVPGDISTIVPCGSGEENFAPESYFNINGMAAMEASLLDLTYGAGEESIPYFHDNLIYPANHFLISYADNYAEHWSHDMYGTVPVNSGSTFSNNIFGSTAGADELFAVRLHSKNIPSTPLIVDSLWSEGDIHVNMLPNPDGGFSTDNDVNALAFYPDQYIQGIFYFTVSSQAHYNLTPGSIYQFVTDGVIVEVINCSTHLGLPESTDINAFDFAWVWDSLVTPARYGLAILFSVAAEDWTTAEDESGGLNPGQIYYSFLNGTYDDFSAEPLDENIDAIAVTPISYIAYPPEIIIDFVTEIIETKQEKKGIKIYPNPAKDIIYIKGEDMKTIQLYSLDGRLVIDKIANKDNVEININNLSSGIYYIHVTTNDSKQSKKIIKK